MPPKVKLRRPASLMEHAFYDIMSPGYKLLWSGSPSWQCNGAGGTEEENLFALFIDQALWQRLLLSSTCIYSREEKNQCRGIWHSAILAVAGFLSATHRFSLIVFLDMDSSGMIAAPSIAGMLEMTPLPHLRSSSSKINKRADSLLCIPTRNVDEEWCKPVKQRSPPGGEVMVYRLHLYAPGFLWYACMLDMLHFLTQI